LALHPQGDARSRKEPQKTKNARLTLFLNGTVLLKHNYLYNIKPVHFPDGVIEKPESNYSFKTSTT